MNWFEKVISGVEGFFTTPAAKTAINHIVGLSEEALPIVEDLAKLTPNRTVGKIAGAAEKYGVPISAALLTGGGAGAAQLLETIAVAALKQKLGAAGNTPATSALTSAVNLAYSTLLANKGSSQAAAAAASSTAPATTGGKTT